MNKTKTRCLSLALAIGVLALFGSGVASAQLHTTGFNVTKTCPQMPVPQGAMYQCSFSVTNQDPDHAVALTSVTNTFPWISAGNPGNGPTVAVPCMQGGSPVTQLGNLGSATSQCGGTVDEAAPIDCNTQSVQLNDRIAVSGTDLGPSPFLGLPASGGTTNGPLVSPLVCNDGLLCTNDACTPSVGCTTTPVVCNDGNLCTANDACDPTTGSTTVCLGTPVVCNDGDACTIDSCDPATGSTTVCITTPDPACSEIEGRMTGGGSVFAGMNRVTHGFELHCDELDLPNNLEVNWGRGNNFHLEELLTATCTEDPAIDQTPPGHSPFDTFIGTGIGRCNGVPGALISFTFVDGGEPGFKHDTASIEITNCPDSLELLVSGPLKKGNHQAHQNTPQ